MSLIALNYALLSSAALRTNFTGEMGEVGGGVFVLSKGLTFNSPRNLENEGKIWKIVLRQKYRSIFLYLHPPRIAGKFVKYT